MSSLSDIFFEYFLEQIELNNIIISMTLYMNGLIIEGQIIQSKDYYEKLSKILDDIANKNKDNLDSKENQKFEDYRESLRQFMADRATDSRYESEYIHMERATIWQPGTEEYHAHLWRGKISAVDSFSIGSKSHVEETGQE
jgi:hypothetical protein